MTGARADPDAELRALVHSHSLFFDNLVEMIPANIYVAKEHPTDQWVHGMSKKARAASKRATKENLKKAKRARLDPENARTTLEVIRQQEKAKGPPSALPGCVKEEPRTVTFEELRERLHKRIELLRSKRHADAAASTAKVAKDWQTEKKIDSQKRSRKNRSVEDPIEADRSPSKRPKRESKSTVYESVEAEPEFEFGRVKMGVVTVANLGREKKRKESKEKLLAKATALQQEMQDPEKGQEIATKHSWSAAVSRAAGEKVLDNPKLLKKSMKKDEQHRHKSAKKWQERKDLERKAHHDKQQTRKENIGQRQDAKKERQVAKREKKLARPGFEGRKQGFINKGA